MISMKEKIILFNPAIPHYRLFIYKKINTIYDLTICHGGDFIDNVDFKQIIIKNFKFGPFIYFFNITFKFLNNFGVVITDGNLRNINYYLFQLNPFRKYKVISWTIGVSASYKNQYDKNKGLDFLRVFLFNKNDALLFYSIYPYNKYKNIINNDKIFIANNTVENPNILLNECITKDSIIFIGTLYKEKNIFNLLYAYFNLYKINNNLYNLFIIGDGDLYNEIDQFIINNKLNHKIFLLGKISNNLTLSKYFQRSFACISPGQAGLSVLTSFSFGVPFITKFDAITGGEIFNIINLYNGIIYLEDYDLQIILNDIKINSKKYLIMGENASIYYSTKCCPDLMIESVNNAIKYVLNQ
jgi:hypothetical protein